MLITAHAVLATLAFGLLFPVGGIIIRLASFRGAWIVHALFQVVAFILYIVAFGIGIYLATHLRLLGAAHVIIGIVLFVLLFLQPLSGWLHHRGFIKYGRRGGWSYAHLWLGRGIITLGIVNGGLGLQLAERTRFFAPPRSAIVAYSVVAGIVWLVYVLAAVVGERRRSRITSRGDDTPPPQEKERRRVRRVHRV